MPRPLLFRFREWLADRFGFQYPEQRVRPRRKLSEADRARMRSALMQIAAALGVLFVLASRREGRGLLYLLLLAVGLLASFPLVFI